MRAVIQRVSMAAVAVAGETISQIRAGLLVLVGVEEGDTDADTAWLARKLPALRIFPDEQGRMNRSLLEIRGELLLVSQFTLLADAGGGNRPAFTRAAKPPEAEALYRQLAGALSLALGAPVQLGRFGADMAVSLVNDGPVTVLLDSRDRG